MANISSIKDLLTDLYKTNTQSKNTRLPSTSIYYSVEVKTLLSVKIISSETAPQDGKWTCKICLKYVSPNRMRCHVGKHILRKEVQPNSHLGGFCGLVGSPVSMVITSGKGKNATFGPKSVCSYFYQFSLKPASVSKPSAPCTNRPVECNSCINSKFHFWSHNIASHYSESNPLLDPPSISEDEHLRVLQSL